MNERGFSRRVPGLAVLVVAIVTTTAFVACSSGAATPPPPQATKAAGSTSPAAGAATTAPSSASPAAAGAPATKPGAITMKMGHLFATTHFEQTAALKLQELINEKTKGAVKLEIFPASQLGSEAEMFEQVRSGAIQLTVGGGGIVQFVPEVGLHALPALWRDADHFKKVINGPIGAQLTKMVDDKNVGFKTLGWTVTGFRQFMHRSKLITKTADFAGVKIRVDTLPASAAIWSAVGANPVPMAFNEVYSALQTGVIDAAEQPPAGTIAQKFYEQAKYHTLTAHQLTVMGIFTNAKWWNDLPADVKPGMEEAFKEYVPLRTQLAFDAEKGAIEQLKTLGGQVAPLEDPDVFRSKLGGIQKEFGDKYGVNDIIEAIKNTQ